MAVAETPTPQKVARNPQQQLAIRSLLGGLFLVVGVWLVLAGLPTLWRELGLKNVMHEFLAEALLLVVTVPAIAGLLFAAHYLYVTYNERGVRAGAVLGAVLLFTTLLLALWAANLSHAQFNNGITEAIVCLVVGGALLFGLYCLYVWPAWGAMLGRLEDNGWFDVAGFKPNQGVRVRRGTVVGILTIVACGEYVLVTHHSLHVGSWEIPTPFMGENRALPMMFQVHITALLVIAVVAAWLAWRIVNWPTFADFLIATEAEMNKVSWTTRKRLVQDSIVVLVTVFLMTVFLFAIDILWVYILSNPVVKVLQTNTIEDRAKQNTPTTW
jgi:preprotein translocase SecE subunit